MELVEGQSLDRRIPEAGPVLSRVWHKIGQIVLFRKKQTRVTR